MKKTLILAGLLSIGVFVIPQHPVVASLSSTQIEAILGLVSSFGADVTTVANVRASLTGTASVIGSGSPNPPVSSVCAFARPLTVGSTGSDVSCLQRWLVTNGYSVPAGASGYFGLQTQSAIASWQRARGIAPATGYFGPLSQQNFVGTAPPSSQPGSTMYRPKPTVVDTSGIDALMSSINSELKGLESDISHASDSLDQSDSGE